jgi:hypothetical protein
VENHYHPDLVAIDSSRIVVHWVNWAGEQDEPFRCFFVPSRCPSLLAVYDAADNSWVRVQLPPGADTVGIRLIGPLRDGGGVLVEMGDAFGILTQSQVALIEPPVADSGGVKTLIHFHRDGPTNAGHFLLTVIYCPRGNDSCGVDPQIRREILTWRPGESPTPIVVDTLGVLAEFRRRLIRTQHDRPLFAFGDTGRRRIRALDRWDNPVTLNIVGDPIAALEDTLADRTLIVSDLGEIEAVLLPRREEMPKRSVLRALLARLGHIIGLGQEAR